MKILIVEPLKHPRRADIPHTLEEMQEIVGGNIQTIFPFDDRIVLVCDDEGKLKGYEPNRYIPEARDIIVGTFFICGLGEEDFTDLPDDLTDKFEKRFQYPQVFYRTLNGIVALSEDGSREMVKI